MRIICLYLNLKHSIIAALCRCDVTVAFCNSTMFSKALMEDIEQVSRTMRVGSFFITITKPIVSEYWQMFESSQQTMLLGWDPDGNPDEATYNAEVYLHRKIK